MFDCIGNCYVGNMLKIQIKNIFDLWVDSVVIETVFILVTLVPCRNRYWVLTQHFNSRSICELNCLNIQNSPGTPLIVTTLFCHCQHMSYHPPIRVRQWKLWSIATYSITGWHRADNIGIGPMSVQFWCFVPQTSIVMEFCVCAKLSHAYVLRY